jgi:hypothetical protein
MMGFNGSTRDPSFNIGAPLLEARLDKFIFQALDWVLASPWPQVQDQGAIWAGTDVI